MCKSDAPVSNMSLKKASSLAIPSGSSGTRPPAGRLQVFGGLADQDVQVPIEPSGSVRTKSNSAWAWADLPAGVRSGAHRATWGPEFSGFWPAGPQRLRVSARPNDRPEPRCAKGGRDGNGTTTSATYPMVQIGRAHV